MKRHAALISLSHDHHHALVEARRLRRAADRDDDPGPVAAAFADFFAAVSVPHFREEEETLFPLVAGVDEALPLVVEALLDHQRLYALVAELERSADVRPAMREIGQLLEAHVRREERELFPLIERMAAGRLESLGRSLGGGPVWGQASEDLNATLLEWGTGEGPAEHVNDERDVLVFLVDGAATITIDDDVRDFGPGDAVIVAKGRRRKITAGAAASAISPSICAGRPCRSNPARRPQTRKRPCQETRRSARRVGNAGRSRRTARSAGERGSRTTTAVPCRPRAANCRGSCRAIRVR